MLFQTHISLLQAELSSSCSPSASGVSCQGTVFTQVQPPLNALSISEHGTFLSGTMLFLHFFQGLHSEQLQTSDLVQSHAGKGWENWRRLAERVTTVVWDDYTNGSASFDVSSFLIIIWSSARFAFWEMLLHFSPIKMVCFLSVNKLEEETHNNLQYIRQLLLCNDIKWWLY